LQKAPKEDGQRQITTDSHLAHLTDIFVNKQAVKATNNEY
jgi:hypothetical protein